MAGLSESLMAGDAISEARRWIGAERRADLLLVDPPRTGMKGLEEVAVLARKRLVYVSCDPVTLSRDLRPLISQGWALHRVDCFEMFPQSSHVETLAVLRPPSQG